jgi:putative hemolysin
VTTEPLGWESPNPERLPELRAGQFSVRLARDQTELDAVQTLRYQVFYGEMGAIPDPAQRASGRDHDAFDAFADHLIVVDRDAGSAGSIIATYRLLQSTAAAQAGGFYSAGEYDIGAILSYRGRILELGRSCVHPEYRNRTAMQLLWRGIAAYVFHNGIDLMFGCASLPGTDPDGLRVELSYLYHFHLAPPPVRPRALPERYVEMQRLEPAALEARQALGLLPPLIKGYLRLGGFVGDGAVVDAQFNTTDVAIVVKTDLITDRYYRHYERQIRGSDA